MWLLTTIHLYLQMYLLYLQEAYIPINLLLGIIQVDVCGHGSCMVFRWWQEEVSAISYFLQDAQYTAKGKIPQMCVFFIVFYKLLSRESFILGWNSMWVVFFWYVGTFFFAHFRIKLENLDFGDIVFDTQLTLKHDSWQMFPRPEPRWPPKWWWL